MAAHTLCRGALRLLNTFGYRSALRLTPRLQSQRMDYLVQQRPDIIARSFCSDGSLSEFTADTHNVITRPPDESQSEWDEIDKILSDLQSRQNDLQSRQDDLRNDSTPLISNPYAKPYRRCILCEHNVALDYKNLRLLSQFVSPHTGRIYSARVTGLCTHMQARVSKLIRRAKRIGFMPRMAKELAYMDDPKLFDPFKYR